MDGSTIFVLFVTGLVAYLWLRPSRGSPASEQPVHAEPRAAVRARPAEELDDAHEFELVGESHYQAELLALFGPKRERGVNGVCEAFLSREPSNKHDKNAVRCEISGLTVGYLARDDAKEMQPILKKQPSSRLQVVAVVKGGWKNGKSEGSYGVTVQVPADLLE